MKKLSSALALLIVLSIGVIGCSEGNQTDKQSETNVKTLVYGTTAYGAASSNEGVNPHMDYAGWSTVRYGVGETLFKYNNKMEVEPWLAENYKQLNENTWQISLKEGIRFSNGRELNGQAVKECLEHLISVHDRAPEDLKIDSIQAEGNTVTITTKRPVPAFINYLSDPYGAIIDMEAGIDKSGNVIGTGPFVTVLVTGETIELVKNENYWDGAVKTDKVIVKAITDGDTLTMALQSGEIQAAQGLPYASLPLFENSDQFNISSVETSRVFFTQMNFNSKIVQDENIRKAIAMSIDKESFVSVLLNGNGKAAKGPFPESFAFGEAQDYAYAPNQAVQLLSESGWTDTDGDGYADKNGDILTVKWLTYPSRQELPVLAEVAQASLKGIGIKVDINCTANHNDFLNTGDWDVYSSSFVAAPTGDPEYFFTTHALPTSAKNRGSYFNETVEALGNELATAFEVKKRNELGEQMVQEIIDDAGFIFVSYLKMSLIMDSDVTGFQAHPSDYYEITADLDINW